jgi:uncharacterized protein
LAAHKGYLEIVKVLIEHGASVDGSRTNDGITPLLIAAQEGHLEIMKVLIEHDASADNQE